VSLPPGLRGRLLLLGLLAASWLVVGWIIYGGVLALRALFGT